MVFTRNESLTNNYDTSNFFWLLDTFLCRWFKSKHTARVRYETKRRIPRHQYDTICMRCSIKGVHTWKCSIIVLQFESCINTFCIQQKNTVLLIFPRNNFQMQTLKFWASKWISPCFEISFAGWTILFKNNKQASWIYKVCNLFEYLIFHRSEYGRISPLGVGDVFLLEFALLFENFWRKDKNHLHSKTFFWKIIFFMNTYMKYQRNIIFL